MKGIYVASVLLLFPVWGYAQSFVETLRSKLVNFPSDVASAEPPGGEHAVHAADLVPEEWYVLMHVESALPLHDGELRWRGIELNDNRLFSFDNSMFLYGALAPAFLVRLVPDKVAGTFALQMGTGCWLSREGSAPTLSWDALEAMPFSVLPEGEGGKACQLKSGDLFLTGQVPDLKLLSHGEDGTTWYFFPTEQRDCPTDEFARSLCWYMELLYMPYAEELFEQTSLTSQEEEFMGVYSEVALESVRTGEEYEQLMQRFKESFFSAFVTTGLSSSPVPARVPLRRYTLDGRPILGTPRGLHLVRQADGRARLEVAR